MATSEGAPGPVDIARIEDELAGLWEQQDESAASVSRTVLLTLLAYCRDGQTAQRVSASAAAISADHPARAIIVTDEPAEHEPNITAWASVSCQLVSRSDKQHCSEQIFLQAHGADMGRIASAVQPLALPDVPLVLWVAEEPPESELFDKLVQESDRLLVESGRSANAVDLFRWTMNLGRVPGPTVVDLTWVKLESMRLALAQQFDPEKWRRMLPEVDCVEVTGACHGGIYGAEALLMAGWIVSRLQWYSFSVEGAAQTQLALEQRDRRVRLIPSKLDLPVEEVKLRAADGFEVGVRYASDGGEAVLRVEAEETCEERRASMKKRSPEQLLCGALEIAKQESVYLESVQTALRLVGGG